VAEQQPATAEAAPSSPSATAAATPGSKGKAPASPEQVAAAERRHRAQAAAARIAAGTASEDDWEVADGTVSKCSVDA